MAAVQVIPKDLASMNKGVTVLTTTPTAHLVQYVQFYVKNFTSTARLLQSAANITTNQQVSADVVLAINRFKSVSTSFIQSRQPEKNASAILLIKAAVQAAGVELFQDVLVSWTRNHITLLKKFGDYESKTTCLTGLAHILSLCQLNDELDRDVVVPNFPVLVRACISVLKTAGDAVNSLAEHKARDHFLDTFIQALIILAPQHLNILRTFQKSLQTALKPWVISHGLDFLRGGIPKPLELCERARYLSILVLGAKKTFNLAWKLDVEELILHTHRTIDLSFRALDEAWRATSAIAMNRPALSAYELSRLQPEDRQSGPFDLPSWEGIENGLDRLLVSLSFLQAVVSIGTKVQVDIPVQDFFDVSERILMLSPQYINPTTEHSRREREFLEMALHGLQGAALRIQYHLVSLFEMDNGALIPSVLDRIESTWPQIGENIAARAAIYATFAKLLNLVGDHISNRDIGPLSPVFRACCDDVMACRARTNADSGAIDPKLLPSQPTDIPIALSLVANDLLRVTLQKLQDQQLSTIDGPTRTLLVSTALLTSDEKAMLSATMNHPDLTDATNTSILPMLARAQPDSTAVEALVRPQMPIIMRGIEGADHATNVASTSNSSAPHEGLGALQHMPALANKRSFVGAFGSSRPEDGFTHTYGATSAPEDGSTNQFGPSAPEHSFVNQFEPSAPEHGFVNQFEHSAPEHGFIDNGGPAHPQHEFGNAIGPSNADDAGLTSSSTNVPNVSHSRFIAYDAQSAAKPSTRKKHGSRTPSAEGGKPDQTSSGHKASPKPSGPPLQIFAAPRSDGRIANAVVPQMSAVARSKQPEAAFDNGDDTEDEFPSLDVGSSDEHNAEVSGGEEDGDHESEF